MDNMLQWYRMYYLYIVDTDGWRITGVIRDIPNCSGTSNAVLSIYHYMNVCIGHNITSPFHLSYILISMHIGHGQGSYTFAKIVDLLLLKFMIWQKVYTLNLSIAVTLNIHPMTATYIWVILCIKTVNQFHEWHDLGGVWGLNQRPFGL